MGRSSSTRSGTKHSGFWCKIPWAWLIFGAIFLAMTAWAIQKNYSAVDYSADKFFQSISIDNSDLKIDWDRYQTTEINLPEIPTIIEPGTYHLTGTLLGAPIVVDANMGEVRLILDNATIDNPTGPAILCNSAQNLVIELVGENILQDGADYTSEDVASVIYSKSDLFFSGNGKLIIDAQNQNAITGKDDVKFSSGTYKINAASEAIHGKNSVYFAGGDFEINSVSHAVEVANNADYGKGFILAEAGNFKINSSAGKGLKSTNNILLYGGNFEVFTFDDAIHSDNHIGVVGGNLNINSGDDGIHASNELIIDGGSINIAKSYEGLEAQAVTINNGKISVNTLDDGINAGSGADKSSVNRPGANDFKTDENCILSINGGEIYINSSGDGVDSNGYLVFNGGKTIIDGPTDGNNGALDSGLGTSMQSGEVVAVGSSGMATNLGENSEICNLSVYFNSEQPAGTKIEIKNSKNEVILSHISAKTFKHLAAGTSEFSLGETYTIYLNDAEYTNFTILSSTTTIR